MSRQIRTEDPVLGLSRASLTLHFVQENGNLKGSKYPNCPHFTSMELDLLATQFQHDHLFGSECVVEEARTVTVLFPDSCTYNSEGDEIELRTGTRELTTRVLLSRTVFFKSDLIVWHATITPAEGGGFSEFDLIKLIHTYDGLTERTELWNRVEFRFENGAQVLVKDLVRSLTDSVSIPLEPDGGTVELPLDSCVRPEDMTPVLKLTRALAEIPDPESEALLDDALKGETPTGKAILAICGVITGILDFQRIGKDEVVDTFRATVATPGGAINVNRSTLTEITDSDRSLEVSWESIGATPYLLIPHAVLLHNEGLVAMAEGESRKLKGRRGRDLGTMERVRDEMESRLVHLQVPNVFNYRTERELYSRGAVDRGSTARLEAGRAELEQLKTSIQSSWRRRGENGQLVIGVLLFIITAIPARDVVLDLLKGDARHSSPDILFVAIVVALAAVIVTVTLRTRR